MSTKNYSIDALVSFMDLAARKGLLKKNTAQSRKAAAMKVLGVLDPEELIDLRLVDIDHAFERFQNMQGMDYHPESLQVYKSRLKSALSDFVNYVDNPSGFKPGGTQKNGASQAKKSTPAKQAPVTAQLPQASVESAGSGIGSTFRGIKIPVPLRDGLTVEIINIPADLTEQEAAKLAAIVKAYAMSG